MKLSEIMHRQMEREFTECGLPCAVWANPMGYRCGYVGIPNDHPLAVEMSMRAVEECGPYCTHRGYLDLLVALGQRRTRDYRALCGLCDDGPGNGGGESNIGPQNRSCGPREA